MESLEARSLLAALSVDVGDAGCSAAGPVYCEIQQAVNVASEGDEILVNHGTYSPIVINTANLTIREADANSDPIIDATRAINGVQVNADGVMLEGFEVQNARSSGFFVSSSNNTLLNNTARGSRDRGFTLSQSDGNTLQGNWATDNVTGFRLDASNNNSLIDNTASRNVDDGFFLGGIAGTGTGSSNDNMLLNNTASENEFGYFLRAGQGNVVKGSSATDNDRAGFILFSSRFSGGTLQDNTASGNTAGFVLASTSGNTLHNNTSRANLYGFRLADGGGGDPTSDNVLQENQAVENTSHGYFVDGPSHNNTFIENAAAGNAGFGFSVDDVLTNAFDGNQCMDNGLGHSNLPAICDDKVLDELSGDWNGNGFVEQGDLDLVLQNWGQSGDPAPDGWTGILPQGNIDQDELDSVLLNWGAQAETQVAATSPARPEPLVEEQHTTNDSFGHSKQNGLLRERQVASDIVFQDAGVKKQINQRPMEARGLFADEVSSNPFKDMDVRTTHSAEKSARDLRLARLAWRTLTR